MSFAPSPGKTNDAVRFGTRASNAHRMTGSLALHGPLSCSYGATLVGGVITDSLSVSGTVDLDGLASGTVAGPGSFLGITTAGVVVLGAPESFDTGTASKFSGSTVIATSTALFSNSTSINASGTISSSAGLASHTLAVQAGATLTGSLINHGGVTITNGALSSSGGATFLGSVFADGLNISGAIDLGGMSSGTVGGPGSFLGINTDGEVVLGVPSAGAASSFSGSKTTILATALFSNAASIETTGSIRSKGLISGSAAAVVGGTATFTNDASIVTSGSVALNGTLSSSAASVLGGTATFTNGTSIKCSGTLSSSGGAVFNGTVIANTIQASSSIMTAGALTVTGTISSSAEGGFHTLKSQAGTTLTGSLVNHGSVTIVNGTLSSSSPMVIGDTVTFTKAASIVASGSIALAGTLSSSAASVIGGTVTLTNESGLSASGSAAFGGAAIDTDFGIVLPNNTTTGRLKANSVVTYSSRQLKTNIEDIKDPINKIMSLRGVSYNWKDSGQPDIGLVAEEVKNIIPEVVHDSKDYMALDYSRLTSILIEAVKAQQSQILALTKEVDGLKNKK